MATLTDRVRSASQLSLLLDCNNICHAFQYAIGSLSHEDQETGIIFGFLLQLIALQKRFRPYRWIFAWDGWHSLRKKIYPQYKGNRVSKRTPGEEQERQSAFRQFDLLRTEIIPQLGLGEWNLRQHGYEADDLIACAARMLDGKKVIVSQDSDLYQLLDWDCSIYNSRGRMLVTEQDFRQKYRISSDEWVQVKSIAGCSSDNIAGVPRVGEVTAIKYLRGELPANSKTHAAILSARDVIVRNRRLVELPYRGLQLAPRSLGPSRMSEKGFVKVCEQYGFDSFFSNPKHLELASLFGWDK